LFDTHQHYEELCALAATGQMPESEITDFRAHLADCPECSALLADFARTSVYLAASHAAVQRSHEIPDGMTERFIARARTQGIAVSPRIVHHKAIPTARRWIAAAGAVAAAALVVVVIVVLRMKTAVPQDAARSTPVHASEAAPSQLSPSPSADQSATLRTQVDALTMRLAADREAMAAAQREKQDLQVRLAALELEEQGLKANDSEHVAAISRLQAEIDRVNKEKAASDNERVATISKLQTDIDKLNSEKTSNDVAILAEENELRVLRQTLAQKEAALEQQHHLNAVGRQVWDLIDARNLQMIDVYDNDGEGNQQQPVGRIFYTAGKSLTFYVFDLNSQRQIDQEISFYAWGERLGDQRVRKLGIFHNEHVNDGRWVLTFDDPRVLAQINSVFVTMEQNKKSVTTPSGKRMLSTFLGSKANHP